MDSVDISPLHSPTLDVSTGQVGLEMAAVPSATRHSPVHRLSCSLETGAGEVVTCYEGLLSPFFSDGLPHSVSASPPSLIFTLPNARAHVPMTDVCRHCSASAGEVSDGSQPCMTGDNINESEHASSCLEPNTTPSPSIPQPSTAQPSHSPPLLHPNSFPKNEFIDLESNDIGTQSRKPR
ncbi:hypothetical protein Cgig2_016827 [Carnegiea gigantea]|uniref:Uncharacterized protein n=1 Tax=Carnegiea gigantea TaxID=171969 RepID=A0A9Q1K9C2_9CARY|nr:hypothetical protein Cgig2_016827 [Carnegiea gigantea]